MKVVFETCLFVDVPTMIDPDETPLNIIRQFRRENPEKSHWFFSNGFTEELFEDNCFDELSIEFTLVTYDDGLLQADCDIPLSKQSALMTGIKQIQHNGRTPCFVLRIESGYFY